MSKLDPCILVVDDDPAILETLRRQFETRCQVFVAQTAEAALESLRDRPVDILLTDQRLPGMTGLELISRARELQPDIVAIVLSAFAEPEDLLSAINEGRVYGYVRKPAHPAELATTVSNALEAAALRKERDRLLERLQRRLDALSILYEVSAEAAYPRSYAQLVDVLTRAMHRVVRFDLAASLIVKDAGRAIMHVHATSPCDEDTLLFARDRTVELLSTLTGSEIGETELLIDVSGDRLPPEKTGRTLPPGWSQRRIGSSTHIPLISGSRTVGVIYLAAFREHAFSPDDEKLLYVLANQTSEAVARLEARILEERRKMALMVESMADGVIMTDESGEVCLCNPAARRLLGIESHVDVTTKYLKEKLGFYPFDLVRGQTADLIREEVRVGDKHLHSIVSPVQGEGAAVGVVVVLRDITERKELEQRKEEFVTIVSHELRTPLTSITGALDIVLNNYPQSVGEKARRYVLMAREGCAKLGAIVDDLLDVAKLERGKVPLRFSPLHFDAVVHDAVEKFRPAADAKKITLEVQVEQPALRLVADADRLTQVLNNLLSNALKFTPDGGRVVIEVFGPHTATTHVGLSIWNNGEQIPDEALERIFDKFETAPPSPNRRVGGTGLGLAISRGIVEGHGGRIWVEPMREGAKFVVAMPVAPPDDTTPTPAAPSDATQRTVLLISDRPRVATLLKGMLIAPNRRVQIAEAADDGLAFARERRADLIVLDMDFVGGVAPALLEILKHDPETKNVPLLAIGSRKSLDRTPHRNPDGALVAPLDGETFVAYCEKLLSERVREAPARILICDDDPHIRLICREVLERAGYFVEEADNGQAALELIARTPPDLLVLDVMMPEIDGWGVLRRLQSEHATAHLPVIFLSARGQTADKVRAFKMGAEDYLVKPFDHTELVMRVAKALERRAREASASPTTRLPGSSAIETEIERRLGTEGDFAFCYIDLDNLKSFNDYYGYAKADGVIRQTGDILREVIMRDGNPGDFVGHIAGDDFVMITTPDRVDRVCKTLIETFDRLIPLYYNRVDRERGYIETTDRYGTMRKFPIMSISVAALTSAQLLRDSAELAQRAAEEKRRAKAIPGSSYVRDGAQIWPALAAAAHKI